MLEYSFNPGKSPVVVAHRGASSTHPENTLESFGAALEAGAEIVELDVRLTADGVPVVMHDADVSRTTDGSGYVHDLMFAQVKRLNAGRAWDVRAEVPSLLEVLDLVGRRGGVNLEIKNIPGQPGFEADRERVVEAVLRELSDAAFEGPVLVSSFNPVSIRRSRELAPGVPTGLLTTREVEAGAALAHVREAGHPFALPNVQALLTAGEGFVKVAHGAGVRLGTWTVDDEETLRTLFSWRVDAVATNDPETAVAIRAELARSGP